MFILRAGAPLLGYVLLESEHIMFCRALRTLTFSFFLSPFFLKPWFQYLKNDLITKATYSLSVSLCFLLFTLISLKTSRCLLCIFPIFFSFFSQYYLPILHLSEDHFTLDGVFVPSFVKYQKYIFYNSVVSFHLDFKTPL